MINQTELIHSVLSFSDSFEVTTINKEAYDPQVTHDVLAFQWFADRSDGTANVLEAELKAQLMGCHQIGIRV